MEGRLKNQDQTQVQEEEGLVCPAASATSQYVPLALSEPIPGAEGKQWPDWLRQVTCLTSRGRSFIQNRRLTVGRGGSSGILGERRSKPNPWPLQWASDIVSSMHVDWRLLWLGTQPKSPRKSMEMRHSESAECSGLEAKEEGQRRRLEGWTRQGLTEKSLEHQAIKLASC